MAKNRISSESGVALVSTILIAAVMVLVVTAAGAYAVKSQNLSRRDQDWNAALAAAEAGVDDFLNQINRGVDPCSIPFQPYRTLPGPASDIGAPSQYSYVSECSTYSQNGTLTLTTSGRADGDVRTVRTMLRRVGFLDFLYFTDYEVQDPAITGGSSSCIDYYPNRPSSCGSINFTSGDTINGPLHTNDAMLMCGTPAFRGTASTGYNGSADGGRRWRINTTSCSGTDPQWRDEANDPVFLGRIGMPPSNTALKATADPNAGGNGCLYSGPTSIQLNATGTAMTVISPFTRVRSSPGCAGPAARATSIPSTPVVYEVPLPPNGLVYVQTVPAASSDPNYWSSTETSARCPSSSSNALGYPVSGDVTTGYGCRDGDVFVSGTLRGQLSIAAEDTIIATTSRSAGGSIQTGDIVYDSRDGQSLLGLIANQYVQVYHPVTSGGAEVTPRPNVRIEAAILSLAHSFIVQNYNRGTQQQQLSVYGAIAQKFRGPVGTIGATGYLKDYNYDIRLRILTPPAWVPPVLNRFQVQTWTELAPQATPTTGTAS